MLPYLRKQRMQPTLAEFLSLLQHRSLSLPADMVMALPPEVRCSLLLASQGNLPYMSYLRKQRLQPTLAECLSLLQHRSLSLPADMVMALPQEVSCSPRQRCCTTARARLTCPTCASSACSPRWRSCCLSCGTAACPCQLTWSWLLLQR